MIAVDSSVAIPLFATWHELHERARPLLRATLVLPSHVLLETYSVLTRLPDPFRMTPTTVADWLARQFPVVLDAPPGTTLPRLVSQLAEADITGGAVYDALVAATCRHHGASLVTADRRANRVYELLGVEVEALGS